MDLFAQFEELNKPTVHPKPWMEKCTFLLASQDSLAELEAEILAAGKAALDLETTGLDQRAFDADDGKYVTRDKIVGMCFATTPDRGWYVPMRHREQGADANVPPRLVVAMVKRLREKGVKFYFHNAKFDIKFLKYEPAGSTGDWDDPNTWEDNLILTYLKDSRDKTKGLKAQSKRLLDREMIELKELFIIDKGKKKEYNFSKLDPRWTPTLWYAASDAMCTFALTEINLPLVVEKDSFGNSQKTVYLIEKVCALGTLYMEQCRIYVDRERLVELLQKGQKEWWDCLVEVYDAVEEVLDRDARPNWFREMERTFDPDLVSPDYMEFRAQCMRRVPKDSAMTTQKSVVKLRKDGEELSAKIELESVNFPGCYDVTIPSELGKLFRELGVPNLIATAASGQVKTSKDVLEAVISEAGEAYPWMKKISRFREVTKALGNVLFNLYRDTTPERSPDGCVWANFNGLKVETGRFSTPTPRNKKEFHGQVNWNVQSTKAAYYDKKNPPPECVYRQREVIAARPATRIALEGFEGKFRSYAVDYSGVELRIVTNLSGEPKWLHEFFHCSKCDFLFERDKRPPPFCPECGSDKIGDLHTLTTMNIYGIKPEDDPKYFKMKRQDGKIVNFLLCYGGTGTAVMRSVDNCGKEEGWRIKHQFDKTYRVLQRWWSQQHALAKKWKYVMTPFGRKYPVPDIDHEFMKFRSKAERNAVNGPVQGGSADIMKLAMGLLYRAFKKKGWILRKSGADLIYMVITIHDELVFEIHDSIAEEALELIERIMCFDTTKNLPWQVPLKVDIEFGDDWTVPYNYTEMSYNQGGGDWTSELVKVFPKGYANYLSHGGKPVEGVDVDSLPEDSASSLLKPPPPKEEEEAEEGGLPMDVVDGIHRFVLSSNRLTPENAERVARALLRCRGKGMDDLRVVDEHGYDLVGETFKVAVQEFKAVAIAEGL